MPDPLIDPGVGAAGDRFQVVGQTGWTPGETVTLEFGFSDTPVEASYSGAMYHGRQVTVLRDGTWSFPVVINQDLFPFPLWRPGYIAVKASSPTKTVIGSFVYTVEGRRPAGLPPLADLGSGPDAGPRPAWPLAAALLAGMAGALIAASGAMRRMRA